jgi:hypothetical protein
MTKPKNKGPSADRPRDGDKPKRGKGAEQSTDGASGLTGYPNAREAIPWGAAIEAWVALIGNGETERHAASLVALDFPGVTRDELRNRCNADPGGWGEALSAAHGRKVAGMERILRNIATGPPPDAPLLGVDPQLERVRASTAQWLLSKWDRETYGDAKRVESSGPGGGPIQHDHGGVVVRYELHAPANTLVGDDPSDS